MSTLLEKTTANNVIIETNINQTTPALPASFNKVLSAIIAIAQQSIEKTVIRAELENLVKTATLRENGGKLNDIGEEIGIIYKNATAAVVNIELVAVNGTEITPQYSFTGVDNGLDYLVNTSFIATGGLISIPVTCATLGAVGNLEAGNKLTLSAPLAGAESIATVVDTQTVGAAAEGLNSYRQRILDEIRNPGEAGNLSFYRKRGKNASGVKEIYPYRGQLTNNTFVNPGDVSVWVEATADIDPDGIASQAVLDAAYDAIFWDETLQIQKFPICARDLYMMSIVRDEVFFTISNLTVFDPNQLGDCKADIETALDEALRAMRGFITGLDYVKEKRDVLATPYFSGVVDDVVKTYSGSYSGLIFAFSSGGTTSAGYVLQPGQLVKLGSPILYV